MCRFRSNAHPHSSVIPIYKRRTLIVGFVGGVPPDTFMLGLVFWICVFASELLVAASEHWTIQVQIVQQGG